MTQYATGTISMDPESDLDYGADWAKFLALTPGDTIATSVWVVPTGLTGHDESHTDTTTTIWLTPTGAVGTRYEVVNHVTTAEGRIEDKTLRFTIAQH